MRTAEITRNTAETNISLKVNLDGTGKTEVGTGVGFLNHMLTLFAAHGKFDLEVHCVGDTDVEDKRGITRYGSFLLPMDEALILAAVDISGRSSLNDALEIPTEKIGSFDTELVEEFFLGFTRSCPMSLHLRKLAGTNSHHIVEGAFKAFGRAMKAAVALDGTDKIPSTKGVLE